MRILAVLFLALTVAPAIAEELYLFDVLQKPAYRVSWDRLAKEVQPTPDWLNQFERNFDGVAGAAKPLTLDGKPYDLFFVCKPHDCAAKKFVVLFEPGGKRAWGALGGAADPPLFYGDPTPAMQEALAAALKG
jgi:hypothetical protein